MEKKDLSFVSGFDAKTYKGNIDQLAKAVGIFLVGCAVATFLLPFALHYIGSFMGIIFTVLLIVAILGLTIAIQRASKEHSSQ